MSEQQPIATNDHSSGLLGLNACISTFMHRRGAVVRYKFASYHFAEKVKFRSTQPSIPPGSVNEYQLWLGRQRQVWLIPIADERVGVQIKL